MSFNPLNVPEDIQRSNSIGGIMLNPQAQAVWHAFTNALMLADDKKSIDKSDLLLKVVKLFTQNANEQKRESAPREVRPNYYQDARGDHDLIWHERQMFSREDLTGAWIMNVFKYVFRFREKNLSQDLRKARTYIDRLIELEEDTSDITGEDKEKTQND